MTTALGASRILAAGLLATGFLATSLLAACLPALGAGGAQASNGFEPGAWRRVGEPTGSFRRDRVPVFVRAFGLRGVLAGPFASELPLTRRFASGPDAVVDRWSRPSRPTMPAGPTSFVASAILDDLSWAVPALVGFADIGAPGRARPSLAEVPLDVPPPVPDAVSRPGSVFAEPPTVTNPFLKKQVVAPQTPDLEMDLDKRTSIGVFSEVGKPATKVDPRDSAGRATRELGAGITLQYRFGK